MIIIIINYYYNKSDWLFYFRKIEPFFLVKVGPRCICG